MRDTLDVARQLTDGGVERRQAEVIARAIREGAEQREHVTPDQLKAGLVELRTELRDDIAGVRIEIENLETRLIRWMVGTVLATGALTVAILRLVG